jgi:ribosomal protein S18 acetylase RimI-like enzyme
MADFIRTRGRYEISTEQARVDLDAVHAYLTRSYWAEGISKEVVAKAVAGSLCFSLFNGGAQVGFARVVTDRATFAYLCDVYVLEQHRGQGLGNWLMEELMSQPELQGLRRFVLVTKDAQRLYEPFGFETPERSGHYMEIFRPDTYKRGAG